MKFENTEVFNFKGALRGMRNPKNSWDKSDSSFESNNIYICVTAVCVNQISILVIQLNRYSD